MGIIRMLSKKFIGKGKSSGEDILEVVKKVKHYHDKNEHLYPLGKRFHYNSRMYLHSGASQYQNTLGALHVKWAKDTPWFRERSQAIPGLQYTKPKLTREKLYRIDSYKKHYKINPYNILFFKALFQEKIYHDSIDLRSFIDERDIEQVRENLVRDKRALLILSTQAVNFIYNYNGFLEADPLDPEFLLSVGETSVDLNQMEYLHAKIYFYTHAIIGASRFYTEEIQSYRDKYVEMLHRLENIVKENFQLVSLDQKFEIMVCAKLLGMESTIRNAVAQEAANSLSRKGDFFIDKLNKCDNKKSSFVKSEHRNVLGLMAFYDRSPGGSKQ